MDGCRKLENKNSRRQEMVIMNRWCMDNQGNPYCGDRQGFDRAISARPEDGNP
jgi:hypothetical protein